MNGYPRQFIDKAMEMPQRVQQKTEYQSSVCLPYVGPASHKIERILKEVGVQVGLGVNWDESPVPFSCHELSLSFICV